MDGEKTLQEGGKEGRHRRDRTKHWRESAGMADRTTDWSEVRRDVEWRPEGDRQTRRRMYLMASRREDGEDRRGGNAP
jgi:hypothetical protein